jgi:hypothetical protein
MDRRFLTKDLVLLAVQHYLPALIAFINNHQKKGIHIIVWDMTRAPLNSNYLHPDSILYEESLLKSNWGESDYKKIALGKALLTQRTKMNSGDVPSHMLRPGECRWRGCVGNENIGVSISGLDAIDDEGFAYLINRKAALLAEKEFQKWDEANPTESFV